MIIMFKTIIRVLNSKHNPNNIDFCTTTDIMFGYKYRVKKLFNPQNRPI